MDWRAAQYEICEGIAAELDKSSEFEEFTVSERQQEGKLCSLGLQHAVFQLSRRMACLLLSVVVSNPSLGRELCINDGIKLGVGFEKIIPQLKVFLILKMTFRFSSSGSFADPYPLGARRSHSLLFRHVCFSPSFAYLTCPCTQCALKFVVLTFDALTDLA